MTSCSLGVNAFRSSIQVAAHQLSQSCVQLRFLTAAPSGRCMSSWQPLAQQQHRRQERRRGCDRGRVTNTYGLLQNPYTPLLYPQRTGLRTLKLSGHRVIIHYVDLPPNYDDLTGLPFRRQDLTADEVATVFGTRTSAFAANKLLRILHGRRVAGTLEDPTVQINTSAYSAKEKKLALAYLRRNVMVDEIVNAGLRAEDELAEMEKRDAEKQEGLTKAETPDEQGSQPSSIFFKKDSQPDEGVYGRGAFDAIRAKNRARYEQDLKRREEEAAKRKQEEAAGAGSGELQTVGERKVRAPSPSMQKWIEKATSDLEAPPELKKWERLLPSAVFVFILTGLAVAYSIYYHPLKRADRMFPDIPPAAATVGALVLLNLGVWFLWKVPPLWPALNRYFLLSAATPKPLSMLGAMFSHQKMSHLLTNMVVLWFVGSRFHDDVGRGNFLATYITTGSLGFLGSLTSLVLRNQLHLTTLGASGGVYGIAVAYFWMHRYECFKLFGLPPEPFNGVPGLGFIGLLAGLNISAMFAKVAKVDVVSHLVGMAMGALAGHLLERRREARQRLKEEKIRDERRVSVGIAASRAGGK
ncbi:hypothetical protein B0H67DRAFT_561769 [Lasiosphaeris hirsuta]|uniref:Peptidase S54 rhomboid domain-containing protein n=1 Tax=Lasiosphaeris hirsuta TaxID=260670 RepID=A0AA40BA85_9PEZI|nr:hypothetical protein B0H67DRAFT_561769 [Lasiosphaeris hirsuta]